MQELNIKEVAPAHAQVSSPITCELPLSQQPAKQEVSAVAQNTTVALMPTTDSRYPTQPILTPVPLSHTVPVVQAPHAAFNISDFEADTSSPFDNMELKTINDMEELASVLQPVSSVSEAGYFSTNTASNYSAAQQQQQPLATSSTYVHPVRQSSFAPTSGPTLIQQLTHYDKSLVGVHPHLNGYASGYSAYANVEHTPQHHQMHPCREPFSYMPVDTTHHFPYTQGVNSSVIPVRTGNCSDQTVYNYSVERKPLPQNSVPQYPFNMYNFDSSKSWMGNQMYNQQMSVSSRSGAPDTSSLTVTEKFPISQPRPPPQGHSNGPDFVRELGQLIKNKLDTTALPPCGTSKSSHPQIEVNQLTKSTMNFP